VKSRLIATVALGAALALGTTGCGMLVPQGTTVQYSPADGMSVPVTSGPIQVRNVLIVATEDGSEGNLVAALVNPTDAPHVLSMEVGEGAGATALEVRVPARGSVSIGGSGEQGVDPILVERLDTPPGATIPVYFQSGDGEGARVDVPVLDGSLDYLADLVP
jgi:hypothetical protein